MRSLKIYLKTVAVTAFCISLVFGTYMGFCSVYEAMQKRLFDDDRGAVVIGGKYIKIFDKEFYFFGDQLTMFD